MGVECSFGLAGTVELPRAVRAIKRALSPLELRQRNVALRNACH